MTACTECGVEVEAKGLCRKHYMRLYRTGSVHLRKPPSRKCRHCDRPHKARGLCRLHYDQFMRRMRSC